jgi:transcriptional regulator
MQLSVDEKWFAFWTMRRRGTANIAIANQLGISRQAVSKALHSIDGKIESALRDMARANRIQIEKIDIERGVLFGRSIPFQTNAYIFVSEKHGMQVWYEHDGDCKACDEFTQCIEFIWDFASELGIKIEKTTDPTKMAEELLTKIRESVK